MRALVAAVLAGTVLLQPAAPVFLWDASGYWNGTQSVLRGGSTFEAGYLSLRGVLTSFVYLPAAVLVELTSDSLAGVAVLAQNAALIAVIGVVLLPRLVGLWRPVTTPVVLVSAAGTGVVLRGFAPFPLMDIWVAALLLTAALLLHGRSRWWLVAAGAAAGAAFNIRPAALLPLLLLAAAVLVARRSSGLWFAAGAVGALVPQFLLNRWRGTAWLPFPEESGALTELQASYAAYIVRYDTVIDDEAGPRLFFCSPGMADALEGRAPTSFSELAVTFLSNFPHALLFSAQKIGAALHWPLSTPYRIDEPGLDGLFALLITTITVVGAAFLLRHGLRARRGIALEQVAVGLVWIGSLATLVTSATETRFAVLLVLVGVAGLASVADRRPDLARGGSARRWVGWTLLAMVAVYAVGISGLGHPVPGIVVLEMCTGG
ncbi:hypothetical protein [Blastococcus saxobsidens]|uniref:hypothetical protein n=1 Tax=Blastococcus saxobsidens TaxID=138336 RepID=UPI000CEC3C2E|nr:hypothetical protein [Blastococcus saxobsidens]